MRRKRQLKLWLRKAGYEVSRVRRPGSDDLLSYDLEREDIETFLRVVPYTMTSTERILALIRAVKYVESARIPGAICECGVWLGGSMMAVADTLLRQGGSSRDLYLYDTFTVARAWLLPTKGSMVVRR